MRSDARRVYAIERYTPVHEKHWDEFVDASKNGTFVFQRSYMDYHRDRFYDYSLIVHADREIVALLPGNRVGDELHSHQGLTYGGLVVSNSMTTPVMLILFDRLLGHLSNAGFRRLNYKTIPYIYHRMPAEEDRYALFRTRAELSRRDVLSVIPLGRRGPVQNRRCRGAVKALRKGVVVGQSEDWHAYWHLLTDHLIGQYGVRPVHSLEEIELLRRHFPENIRLFGASLHGDIVAGIVIYESSMVAHVQYVAASPRGRESAALDALFHHLIEEAFAAKPYFDFGISNEQQGRFLNNGLIEQKEGFGARAVVQDFYTVDLASSARLAGPAAPISRPD